MRHVDIAILISMQIYQYATIPRANKKFKFGTYLYRLIDTVAIFQN